jgi:hypothetical protein
MFAHRFPDNIKMRQALLTLRGTMRPWMRTYSGDQDDRDGTEIALKEERVHRQPS